MRMKWGEQLRSGCRNTVQSRSVNASEEAEHDGGAHFKGVREQITAPARFLLLSTLLKIALAASSSLGKGGAI